MSLLGVLAGAFLVSAQSADPGASARAILRVIDASGGALIRAVFPRAGAHPVRDDAHVLAAHLAVELRQLALVELLPAGAQERAVHVDVAGQPAGAEVLKREQTAVRPALERGARRRRLVGLRPRDALLQLLLAPAAETVAEDPAPRGHQAQRARLVHQLTGARAAGPRSPGCA
jgi:hypothetical protein